MKSWTTHVIWAGIALLAAALGRWSAIPTIPGTGSSQIRSESQLPRQGTAPTAKAQDKALDSAPNSPRASTEQPVVWIQTKGGPGIPLDQIRAWLKSENPDDHQIVFNVIQDMSAVGPLKRELLMEEIKLKEGWIRKSAMWELKRLIGDEAMGILQEALKTDPDVAVREQAAWLLGEPGGEGNIDLLQKAFRGDEFKVRAAAARSLNQLGQPGPMLELLPELTAKLDSPDGGVRRDAVDMLGGFLAPSALPLLTRALTDTNSDVRRSAAAALGNLGETGHPEVIPLLESVAQDPNGDVAETAQAFLKRLK